MLEGLINTLKMYLNMILQLKKALHISSASSLADFTSLVVGGCSPLCKDYSRESCADHVVGAGSLVLQVKSLAVETGHG